MNESITQTIRSWDAPLSTDYTIKPEDTFVIIDVSEPEHLDRHVDIDKVEEVIDHHVGYENFWEERIGSKSNIEFIGAACTHIYESWIQAGLFDQMSETSARLLVSGILDNTLNFKARVTTDRDYAAYEALLPIANLPVNWTAQYFQECEASIFADVAYAVVNDTKTMKFQNLDTENIAFGQLVIWDAKRAINDYRNVIEETMTSKSDNWFVNAVSISDGQSFFLASNERVTKWAKRILNVSFNEKLAIADRLWLRKEIVKQDASTH